MTRVTRRGPRSLAALFVASLGGSILGGSAGCSGSDQPSAVASAVPEPIADHECGACGMIVREEPSPRGQLVHRDGTHVWFCSIADVVAYMGAPSPHGRVEHVWVETLPAEVDPTQNDAAPRPWAEAVQAHYVTGVLRERVMGQAVLVFASEADARAAASRLGGRVTPWTDVVTALGGTP
jgi:nitrous oxide reductase accessory protein NosL